MKSTLYKKSKTDKIQVYTSWTEGAELFSQYGELDGKMQVSSITCTGKNIGRSNETTPEEQAILECVSKRNKKQDKGYFTTIEAAKTEEVFLPMLAKDGRKVKIKYPCDAQPKLDGVRCMATPEGLMSRGGKPYDVKHITDVLDVFAKGLVPDGELYIHGMPLQDLVSLVKKPKDGSENVEYWVYDYYVDATVIWSDRKYQLMLYDAIVPAGIKIVPTYRVNNEEEMLALHDKFVLAGYEGIILREPAGIYELGHRSKSLIKYKKFFDDEYKIVGYKEGIGKYVGCVIWRCITPEGEEFDVTPKGTIEKKKEWYTTASKQIGKDLTVRYWNKTNKGIPAPAVGIIIRDYE